METRKEVGMRLMKLRKDNNLSQEQLAAELQFGDRSMVSCYETGKRDVTIAALIAYAKRFKVTTDSILLGDVNHDSAESGSRIMKAYSRIQDERLRELAITQVEAIAEVAGK